MLLSSESTKSEETNRMLTLILNEAREQNSNVIKTNINGLFNQKHIDCLLRSANRMRRTVTIAEASPLACCIEDKPTEKGNLATSDWVIESNEFSFTHRFSFLF